LSLVAANAARVAIVGAGYFAQFHAQGWQDAGAQLVGVADVDQERARALAQRFEIQTVSSQLEALLEQRPGLVDVVLPPQAQDTVVRQALAAGVPVVCQKPFGSDWAQACALSAHAQSLGLPLVVHENFRFMPWFRECHRLLHSGRLGRVHGISFRLRPGDGQGADAYLSRQPSFRTMPQLLVRETAVHFIDVFRYLCGEVHAVTARLRRLNPVVAGEDSGIVIFEFDDNRLGLFDGNRLNEHPAQDLRRTMGEMWLEAEAGVLRLDGEARLWFKPHGSLEQPLAYEQGPSDRVFGGAVGALQAHVLAHLEHGAALENAAHDYLANLRVQAAIYHSHAQGRRVELASFTPPSAEPFTPGDTP
jgi:predicted dehydrogenase